MRTLLVSALVLSLTCGAATAALGDGGQVRVSKVQGERRITVFTSPNPLRAGPLDVSIFIQDAATGRAVDTFVATVTLVPRDGSCAPLRVRATADQATNKLFRAAQAAVPTPGRWDVRVEYAETGATAPVELGFVMEVAPPLPRWLSVWPWFAWPAGAILLFVVHRVLVARRRPAPSTIGGRNSELLPILGSTDGPGVVR